MFTNPRRLYRKFTQLTHFLKSFKVHFITGSIFGSIRRLPSSLYTFHNWRTILLVLLTFLASIASQVICEHHVQSLHHDRQQPFIHQSQSSSLIDLPVDENGSPTTLLARLTDNRDEFVIENGNSLRLVPIDVVDAPRKPTLRYLSAPLSDGKVANNFYLRLFDLAFIKFAKHTSTFS